MSEDNKKPGGGRDLKDLKARLGLRKGGAQPAGAPQTDESGNQPAPSATAQQQAILPPPIAGVAPPPPEPAPPPDPRRDPFAAQQQQAAANLAAFYGINQALPGSADAAGDTSVGKPKPWGLIGGIAGIALVTLVIGNAFGRLSASRQEYNLTIDHAAKIRAEVKAMASQLDTIKQTVNASSAIRGGIDLELPGKLGGLDLKKPDTNKLFKTNYAKLDDVAIDRLMTYYNNTIQLYGEIESHAKKSEADKDALASFVKNGESKGQKAFGMIVDATGKIPYAQFVEIGGAVCNKQGVTDCPPEELKGFKYRIDSGAAWGEKPVRGKPGETITPLRPTPFFNSIASGSADVLAVKDYARRNARIQVLLTAILKEQEEVLKDLDRAAAKPKLVAF